MALSVYFDASVLVALLVRDDDFNTRAETFVRKRHPLPVVSDFASIEFASAIAKRVRMQDMTKLEARAAFQNLDTWKNGGGVASADLSATDISGAETSLRRIDLALRTADALHIAIARRLDLELATFDIKMAASARALGVDLVDI